MTWSFSLTTLLLSSLVAANPLPEAEPAPLVATADWVFPVNVIMTAGAAQFGMWVDHDGIWKSMYDLFCLNAGANSVGSCGIVSYDQVGVVAGYGPCTIVGSNGFEQTLPGNPGDGFASVAPPQTLNAIVCGP